MLTSYKKSMSPRPAVKLTVAKKVQGISEKSQRQRGIELGYKPGNLQEHVRASSSVASKFTPNRYGRM